MTSFRERNRVANWARLALKCGLLLTDAKLWASISNQMRDHADDLGHEVKNRYDDAVDRMQDVRQAIHGRNHWLGPTMSFVGGIGLGVGLGMMLTPVSGAEARAALKSRVVRMTDKMGDIASGTGTDGD